MEGREREDLNVAGGRIPVFAFPSSLFFNGIEKDQIKQILTIYNPYDFPIKFRVLSTTPDHYHVMEPEGSIKPKNCVDLIIRLTSRVPPDSPVPLESKFRVQVFHANSRQALGRKDVPSTVLYGPEALNLPQSMESHGGDPFLPTGASASESFYTPGTTQQVGSSRAGGRSSSHHEPAPPRHHPLPPHNINYVAIITGLVCILGLLLPTDKDEPGSSILPPYLHLSINQKLLVAYTLGLVTMVIFRP